MTDGLTEFMRRWVFTPEAQVAETGQAKVWKVRTADGQTAAFKLYRRADRGNETAGVYLLQRWQDRGAVVVLGEAPNALLMDWLEGPSLGDIARGGDPATACDLLAETARRLHGAPRVSDEGLKT